jgi:hypothetical protein
MDAHLLENETFEVTNSDMQDSATVIGEDTPGIFVVTMIMIVRGQPRYKTCSPMF